MSLLLWTLRTLNFKTSIDFLLHPTILCKQEFYGIFGILKGWPNPDWFEALVLHIYREQREVEQA